MSSKAATGSERKVDVLVVGAGMVGATLATALGRAGLEVMVIDRLPPETAADDAFDGRASAIALASQQLLAAIGIWQALAPEAAPILEIRVSDGDSLLFLHYDHRDLGDAPLGYMVENRHCRRALLAAAPGLYERRAPVALAALERDEMGVRAALDDGTRVRAQLLVAADGARSGLRRAAGIRSIAWSYRQSGIVCTVAHERPHRGIAHERFLGAGPFAILPLKGRRSSIVWTERAELAPAMMALDADAFDGELARRFGGFLGEVHAIGPRWSYPLFFQHAERYVDERLVLLGDAAHTIHPIAGQGFNMGLRDVAALAEVLIDARRLGLDLGAAPALARYQRWRRADNWMLAAVTDALTRLFSNDIGALALARDLGLAAVDRLPPLKRLFMAHARGTVGALPKLLRGEAL